MINREAELRGGEHLARREDEVGKKVEDKGGGDGRW